MQSRSIVPIAFAAVCCLALIGCHKGTSFGPVDEGDGLSALFEDRLANATQHFSMNATTGGTIHGAGGVEFIFPPNAFQTQGGGIVAGSVNVEVIEVLDIADMILLNITTVGDDNGTRRVLNSGGSVYVSARQGNTELFLGPQGMGIIVPATTVSMQMGVFTANRTPGEDLLWTEADNATITPIAVDTAGSGGGYSYQLQVDSMQWINCDYFPFSPDNTTITAITPSDVPNDSTRVWFVFPTLNAVAGGSPNAPQTYAFGQVPVGLPAIAVSLTRNGDDYRSAFTNFTTTPTGSVGLSYQPTTLQAFEAAVNAL
ncbi:MAG: hypothetical protein JNM62_07640 [Flavobacteriales bacterium]|nr:hypothetical protein [Flavobacteriales bacterium]